MDERKSKAIKLSLIGHKNHAKIARMVGAHKSTVGNWLGKKFDIDDWECERKKHAEFFGTLTPAQEYAEHYRRRAALIVEFGEVF